MGNSPHHAAWLRRNTHRDAEWLQRMIDDGFEVHHLNEDEHNNDPTNVVLLDMGDHALLHGVTLAPSVFYERKQGAALRRQRQSEFARTRGALAYQLRAEGRFWAHIAAETGFDESLIASATKEYAHAMKLKWPLPQWVKPSDIPEKTARWVVPELERLKAENERAGRD